VVSFDAPHVGDVDGKRLLHLQCHIGTDTLSWVALGAQVTGLDFSPSALEFARGLSQRSGRPARFVHSELYDAPAALAGERFDVVYTGVGALNWLPDITGWAQVCAQLLAPGGLLYVRDGHPMLWALDDERDDDELVVRYPYFETAEPVRFEELTSYEGSGELAHPVIYAWNHGLGETVTAVLDAGLAVTGLVEHRELEWQALPLMVEDAAGRWALPSGRDRLPVMFTLTARAPR
jgi:SAM-dependent methyltransferase